MTAARDHPDIQRLLAAVPGLTQRLDLDGGPYGVMGAVAQMICGRQLSDDELVRVFGFFNDWAGRPDRDEDLLATGALEILNDDRETSRLARRMLTGRALEIVEEMRLFWGQLDYTA